MSLSATDNQLKTAFEDEGMTPEEIVQEWPHFDIIAIKARLMQISSKYRKMCGVEDDDESEFNFSKEQHKQIMDVIFGLAISAEDEHLRAKMATYIRDDVKGRKDVVRTVQGSGININFFNQMLQGARETSKRYIDKVSNGHKLIDVK